MKKYGLFSGNKQTPDQTFQGDYLMQEKEYVKVMKYVKSDQSGSTIVAAIRLDKGQVVKEITIGGI